MFRRNNNNKNKKRDFFKEVLNSIKNGLYRNNNNSNNANSLPLLNNNNNSSDIKKQKMFFIYGKPNFNRNLNNYNNLSKLNKQGEQVLPPYITTLPYYYAPEVFFEPQFICQWCGSKKGVGLLVGRCVKCGRILCDDCAEYKGGRIYCHECSPRCFIATAVYGSEVAPQVLTLKAFRNSYMSSNAIGRFLISFYYFVSPHLAEIIEKQSVLRLLLKPYLDAISSFVSRILRL